jgi:hypothetical protein
MIDAGAEFMAGVQLGSRAILLCLAAWLLGIPSAQAADGPEQPGLGDFPQLSAERDWPWWRGPLRNGTAVGEAAYPTTWSDTKNVIWKVPVPGRGHSSPVVVGSRVFLTTSDAGQKIHSVLAFDRQSGKPLWQTEVSRGGFPVKNHPKNTEATPTVACDGERVYATFYTHDTVQATALDLEGKQVWQKTVGPFRPRLYEYGYAPSPLLYQGTVIIAAEFDGKSWIAALDRKTGEQAWKVARPESISFSTPVVAHVAGRDQMLLSGHYRVASFDPHNGKPFWSTPGTTAATCGTIVWGNDIVVASGGYPDAETVAIRAQGKREVLWKNQQKCYEQSMLVHAGFVYALTDKGILFCWQITDGKEMWNQRLSGPVSASPVFAGGNIYWSDENGLCYVFRPNPEKFELVAENHLGEDAFASPAAVAGRLYFRTSTGTGKERQEFLYCIGE